MKGKILNQIRIATLAFVLLFTMWPATVSRADDEGIVDLNGLEIGDTVEIYRFCNYTEEDGYTFASAVTTWLKDTAAGKAYAGITPAKLSSMNSANANEFCQILLMGLKTASTGVANLPGESFEYKREDESTVQLNPGYYMVLPKGATRIYDLKWFKLEPGTELTLTYGEEDYSSTSLTTSVANITNDRGLTRDTYPTAIYGDEIQVTSEILIPQYNEMYTKGKRKINVSMTLPFGVDLVQNSLKVYSAATSVEEGDVADVEYVSLATDNYSVATYEGAVLYKDVEGRIIFFGQDNYFYDMDGMTIAGPDAVASDALAKYNESHGSEYILEEHEIETIDEIREEIIEESGTVEGAEESEELGENAENIVETDEINPQEPQEAVNENLLTEYRGATVIVIPLSTEAELKKVKVTVNAKKDENCSPDGWVDTVTGFAYSVSPLDSNKLAVLQETARVGAYGLRITACLGNYESYQLTTEELLNTAVRMTDDEYTIYKKKAVYDGDIKDSVANINSQSSIQLVYDNNTGRTTEYEELAKLVVNSEGQVAIGGLEKAEYLVIQTKCTYGYELSALSLLIDESDWENDEHMEGNCLMDFIWLNYQTYLLPATGSTASEVGKTWAILIMIFAIIAAAQRYRKNKIIC